jgi:hypothetical protein
MKTEGYTYIPISRTTDATCDRFLFFIYMHVSEVINERTAKHLSKLESHPNPLVETLTQPKRNRRLKNVGPPTLTTEMTSLDGHPTKPTQQDSKLDYRLCITLQSDG